MNPSPGRQIRKVLFWASLLYAPARAFPKNRCWFSRQAGGFAGFGSGYLGSLYFCPGELSEPLFPLCRNDMSAGFRGIGFLSFLLERPIGNLLSQKLPLLRILLRGRISLADVRRHIPPHWRKESLFSYSANSCGVFVSARAGFRTAFFPWLSTGIRASFFLLGIQNT